MTAKVMVSREEKKSYWARHVEGWRRSGLSQRAYCMRHGLRLKSFCYWRRKERAGAEDISFVSVPVMPVARSAGARVHLVVAIGDAYRIEVGDGFDPATLRTLLSVLGSV